MSEIRVLNNAAKPMQRLGFLKRLIRRINSTSTSSLNNLGHDLISTLTKKVPVDLNEERVTYIRRRLRDGIYKSLKDLAEEWEGREKENLSVIANMELQDLFLSQKQIPSHTGKLVARNWNNYPQLAVSLGLARGGTFSINTRGKALLHFTSDTELNSFVKYNQDSNPLLLSDPQILLLLYSMLENDGEVIAPLWRSLLEWNRLDFSDREAGNLLPEIYLGIVNRHRQRLISADARERLISLEKTAESITKWRESHRRYVGSAREEASRPRVEPYVDLGILTKPDPYGYKYSFSSTGRVWADAFCDVGTDEEVLEFINTKFFTTAAAAWGKNAKTGITEDKIISSLIGAWDAIKSPGGYSPISEIALVGGINSLLKDNLILEFASSRETLIRYQKENPYKVRFTVNRMGIMAHARFITNET